MLNITNNGLPRPGTGCFIAVPIWLNGRQRVLEWQWSVLAVVTTCLAHCSINVSLLCACRDPLVFTVEADKGFNYLSYDDSFVCQKKNHFQISVRVGLNPGSALPQYVHDVGARTAVPIDELCLHIHGIKVTDERMCWVFMLFEFLATNWINLFQCELLLRFVMVGFSTNTCSITGNDISKCASIWCRSL